MGTSNPKVSAYVPQAVKDRLTQFREERNISESQAVTSILAEYFGITEVLGRSFEVTGGVTLAQMEAMEKKIASFVELTDSRLIVLENTYQNLSELPVDKSRLLDNIQITSNLPSELSVELPKEDKLIGENESKTPVNLLGEPLLEINPISGLKLSKLRFGLGKDTLAGVKRKLTPEEFTKWTKEKDPDAITWKQVESPVKGYAPAEDLPGELKSRLLEWIKENIS